MFQEPLYCRSNSLIPHLTSVHVVHTKCHYLSLYVRVFLPLCADVSVQFSAIEYTATEGSNSCVWLTINKTGDSIDEISFIVQVTPMATGNAGRLLCQALTSEMFIGKTLSEYNIMLAIYNIIRNCHFIFSIQGNS